MKEKINKQPEGLQEGIYFNLSNEDYHKDPAISCSGVKDLLDNPKIYWHNSLNPKKEQSEDSRALMYGRAAHCLLLEPEQFDKDFIVLDKDDLKIGSDYYNKVKDDSTFDKNFKLPKTPKALTIKYIGKKNLIKKEDYNKMKAAVNEIKEDSFYDDWFKGGYAEISIFWRDEGTGLMCRSRFDYLNINFAVDYKTTFKVKDIKKSIANFSYNLQSTIYLRGLGSLINKSDIFIDGNNEQKEWVKTLAKNNDFNFRFLFQEKTEPYLTRSATLACDILDQSNVLFQTALNIYLMNIEKYGLEKWRSGYDKIEEIRAVDMPVYWNMQLEEQTEKKAALPF